MDGDRSTPADPAQKRPLHESTPYWATTRHRKARHRRHPSSRHWDVIVVGTGISGALAAEALADGRRRVLILDRRGVAEGSSLASTAMIQHEIDVPLHRLARRMGREEAARAWRRSVRAVGELRLLAERLGLDCQMEAKQALYLAGDSIGARGLAQESRMRTEEQIPNELLSAPALRDRFGINRPAAIVSPASASANPAQMTAGFLRAALARGAEIAAPVEVTDVVERDGLVALATKDGHVLTAGHAVFCTGYEFLKSMDSPKHSITSTWAFASEKGVRVPDWLAGFLVWEASEPYLYFRTTPEGRLIIGGEDEDSPTAYRDAARLARNAKRVAEKLGDLTGIRLGTPAYSWAAPFGTTKDGLPIIDRVPGFERVQAVMGFGGNGITFSMIAADIIAGRIAGTVDPDEDLFRYRSPKRGLLGRLIG